MEQAHLLIVDYYSRWIEIARLNNLSAEEVILHTRSIFARHGIPETVISDNGPQFASEAYTQFSREYGFEHLTSSPYFPQSNGEAERAVQTVKALLQKSCDPYRALLAYRATPLQNGYSPAELIMSRKLRTTIPLVRKQRVPKVVEYPAIAEKDEYIKERQRENFNSRHGAKESSSLSPGDLVWITDRETTGSVSKEVAPRSFIVETPDGSFRRNRRHLVKTPEQTAVLGESSESELNPSGAETPTGHARVRTGRVVRPPERWDPSWN